MISLEELLARKEYELKQLLQKTEPYHNAERPFTLYTYTKNNRHYYYRHTTAPGSIPKNREYISCKKKNILTEYAQQEYANLVYNYVIKLLDAIQKLRTLLNTSSIVDIYANLPAGKKVLVDPYEISDEQYAIEWQSQSYESNPYEFGDSNYFTLKNEQVRSKSEIAIADRLNHYGVPYHYEMPLELFPEHYIYPDFTCLNVRTREVFYWEHFGMLDDPEYFHRTLMKVSSYNKSGYLLGKNLLVTYETADHPLDMRTVQKIIEEFLL